MTVLVCYLSFLSAGDRIQQLDGIRFGRGVPLWFHLFLRRCRCRVIVWWSSRRWISGSSNLFVPSSLVLRLTGKIWLELVQLWYLLFAKWTVFLICLPRWNKLQQWFQKDHCFRRCYIPLFYQQQSVPFVDVSDRTPMRRILVSEWRLETLTRPYKTKYSSAKGFLRFKREITGTTKLTFH